MKTNVTCIVPVYNQEKTIGKCIKSLLKQTHKCKIIVVNDGSTDNTAKIVKRYPVKLINIKRSSKPRAINTALKNVKTEFVLIGEGDAYYDKNYIKNSLKYFNDPKVAGTIGTLYVANTNRNFLKKCREIELEIRFRKRSYKPFTAWLFKTKILKEIGGYEEKAYLHDDLITCKKILRKGYKFVYVKDAVWYHHEKTSLRDMAEQRFKWGIGYADNMFKFGVIPKKEIFFIFFILSFISMPLLTLFIFFVFYLLYFLKLIFEYRKLQGMLYCFVIPFLKIYRTFFSTIGFWFGIFLRILKVDLTEYLINGSLK